MIGIADKNDFVRAPQRPTTIFVVDPACEDNGQKVWSRIQDAVSLTADDQAQRDHSYGVVGMGYQPPAPPSAGTEHISGSIAHPRSFFVNLAVGITAAADSPSSGPKTVICISDKDPRPNRMMATQVAHPKGVEVITIGIDERARPACEIDSKAYLVHSRGLRKALHQITGSVARPQTENLALSGLSDGNGISRLADISHHGSNRERQVAATARQTLATASSPHSEKIAQRFALQGLANGVQGPIGPILAKFGQTLMYYSMDMEDAHRMSNSVMSAIAKKTRQSGEAAVAQAALQRGDFDAHWAAYEMIGSGACNGDDAVSRYEAYLATKQP